ncbi:hypothetical protein GOV04_05720 [Candidatus Woesearchaeota archaeon]|nr:hypothetical protein [Candidatus Woesearchaeota archaeon]
MEKNGYVNRILNCSQQNSFRLYKIIEVPAETPLNEWPKDVFFNARVYELTLSVDGKTLFEVFYAPPTPQEEAINIQVEGADRNIESIVGDGGIGRLGENISDELSAKIKKLLKKHKQKSSSKLPPKSSKVKKPISSSADKVTKPHSCRV